MALLLNPCIYLKLAKIQGKSMIEWVYQQVSKAF
jgi:CMP-2-keto-3-deoxyoctulosonic acid synthetase